MLVVVRLINCVCMFIANVFGTHSICIVNYFIYYNDTNNYLGLFTTEIITTTNKLSSLLNLRHILSLTIII